MSTYKKEEGEEKEEYEPIDRLRAGMREDSSPVFICPEVAGWLMAS